MQENAFENVICKVAAILFRLQWVNSLVPGKFDKCQISKFQTHFNDTYFNFFCEIAIRLMPQHLTDQ